MAPPRVQEEIAEALGHLGQGRELRAAVEGLAAKHLVSPATIYRWANEAGLRWRKERTDKGARAVGKDDARTMGALLMASRRLSNKVPLPACDAVAILRDSGMLTDEVSTSTCLRALREHRVSARDITRPTPHRNLRAEHPNHVWQFDVTNCIQYFLDGKKGLGERDTEMTMYKNKVVKTAKNIKRELLRYVVVDKASGAFFFRYFYASGERAADGLVFLYEAMRPKADERYRFHGVPRIIYADRGSIAKAQAVRNMLDALKVELTAHLPGNPRAKGAVEGWMHHIDAFEARLKLQRPRDLDELNSWALDWTVYVNAAKSFRDTGSSRSALWSLVRSEQLRLCPDWDLLVRVMKTNGERRLVSGDLTISFDGNTYRLPDSAQARRHVMVSYNAFDYPNVEVAAEDGTVYYLSPLMKDVFGQYEDAVTFGEFKAHKHTPTQQAKGEMEGIAEGWGLTWTGTADKRKADAPPVGYETPLQVFGHQADKVGNVAFMDKRGTEVELTATPEPRMLPLVKALAEVVDRLGRRLTRDEYQALSTRYGNAIPEDEVMRIVESLKGKEAEVERHIEDGKILHWRARRA